MPSRTPVGRPVQPETRAALLAWFDRHRRDLPWRRTRDPYAIWVSEIMLQQTRVAAVLEHYARWMERFPTVAALAAAEEHEVLALWSGLGYYRRARMLHRAARVIAAEHGGVLPRTAAALRALPGIGAYTSAAIASIAFGEPVAVVDGNVERVVTRLLGLAPPGADRTAGALAREIGAMAQALLATERPGDGNQALMELGATVCLPRAPLCLQCPVQPWCRTRGEHAATPRKPLVARAAWYALVAREAAVLLRQRAAAASLMAGLWELPELPEAPAGAEAVLRLRHAITVTSYTVTVFRMPEGLPFEGAMASPNPFRWCAFKDLPSMPLTGLTRKVLRRLGVWAPDAPLVTES